MSFFFRIFAAKLCILQMKTNQPLVSVIIPLYNSEEYIAETIESVLNQTYKHIEVIVVDDGSTDNSLAVAKQYESDKVRVYHQENSGAPVARNYGFRLSKGQYFQYLDSDDLLTPHKIEKQVEALSKKDDDAIATSSVYVDKDGVRKLWQMPEIAHGYMKGFDMLIDLWRFFLPSLCIGSYLTPRSLVEKSGGWDESLQKNQDGDFFARILENAGEVVFVPNEGQIWRVRANSISHNVSIAKNESVLRSYNQISDLMLKKEDSPRVRKAIAIAYGSYIINDSDRDNADRALRRLHDLQIKPDYRIRSKYFRVLVRFLHPQTAMEIYTKIQKLRGRTIYFAE